MDAPDMRNSVDPRYAAPLPTSGLAIAALVCGIVSLLPCLFPLGVVALVLGIVAINKIDNPANRLSGRGLAQAGAIVGGIATFLGVALIAIGILLPALGSARRTARRVQNATQIRGIHQGLVNHSAGNKEWFAGITEYGRISHDGTANTGLEAHAGVPGAPYSYPDGSTGTSPPSTRLAILLNGNFFRPEFAISPAETHLGSSVSNAIVQAPTAPGTVIEMTKYGGHCSYAWLEVSERSSGRFNNWRDNSNGSAIVLSDRGRVTHPNQGGLTTTSIHTSSPHYADKDVANRPDPPRWHGNITFNDNSTRWEVSAAITTGTRYGARANTNITGDNIFTNDYAGAGGSDDNALMIYAD